MAIEVSPEIETVVRERAAAEGVSVNELLARIFATKKMIVRPSLDPKGHVRSLLAQWQAQDKTPAIPPISTQSGETPTQALFRKWEEEDANMKADEQEQDKKFWEEFQQSIDTERARSDMRPLF